MITHVEVAPAHQSDANADLGVLKKSVRVPRRLLMIGLPLTNLSGFGVGVLLFGGLSKHHKQVLLIAAEGTGDTLALIPGCSLVRP